MRIKPMSFKPILRPGGKTSRSRPPSECPKMQRKPRETPDNRPKTSLAPVRANPRGKLGRESKVIGSTYSTL